MSNPSGMDTDWNVVMMTFTPSAADLTDGTAILTFLAWGDGGSTNNLPPTVFLEGVNTTPIPTPEPATLSLFGAGVFGFGYMRRRRAKSAKSRLKNALPVKGPKTLGPQYLLKPKGRHQ